MFSKIKVNVKLFAVFPLLVFLVVVLIVSFNNGRWLKTSLTVKPAIKKGRKGEPVAVLSTLSEELDIKPISTISPVVPNVDKHGYILTQTYNSQMTRAIRNMMGQQCWAWALGGPSVSIVEPFSSESKLVHFRRFWDALKSNELHNAVLFGKYFDIDYYNKLSIKDKSSPLTLWKDFLSDSEASQKFVAVTLPAHRCSLGLSPQGSRLKVPSKRDMPCFYGKAFSQVIEGLQERFNVSAVKKVCLDCSLLTHRLTLDELRTMIYGKDGDIGKYTVIVNTWRNYAFIDSWLQIPNYCKMAEDPKTSNRLVPSRSVAQHSKLYKEKVIKSKRIVAVMFRIERFFTLKVLGKSNESLSSCLEKTLKIHDQLVQKGAPEKSGTFITLDIGRFGSKLMQTDQTVSKYGQDSLKSVNQSVHDLITKIYNGQFKSIEDWEDSFIEITGGITERGYISMVQRTIAAEADCLVLMGGGSYQQVAISQYLANHPSPCIQTACVSDSILNMLPPH